MREVLSAGRFGERVQDLEIDDIGFLWMVGDASISRVRVAALDSVADVDSTRVATVQRFGPQDGLADGRLEDAVRSTYRASDGLLWFARRYGVAAVDPRVLRNSPRRVPVIVEEIRLGDRVVGKADSVLTAGTRGTPVQIRFTSTVLDRPDLVRFRYRLEGADSAWMPVNGDRVVNYSGLANGTYRFHVQAALDGEDWTDAGAFVMFRELPYWYQTWWAFTLDAFALALIVAAIVSSRRARSNAWSSSGIVE